VERQKREMQTFLWKNVTEDHVGDTGADETVY